MELTNILTCNLDKTPVSPSLQLGPQNKSKNVILGLSRRPRLGDPVYMAVQSTYRVTDTLFIFGAQSETTHNALIINMIYKGYASTDASVGVFPPAPLRKLGFAFLLFDYNTKQGKIQR